MTSAVTDEQRDALDRPHARDVLTSQALLEDATEPRGVIVLTDEELLALDGTDHRPVVALSWAGEQETANDVLAGVAARSVIACGLRVTAADARKYTNIAETGLSKRDLVLAQEMNGIAVLRFAEDARERVRVLLDAHGAASRNTEAQQVDLSQVSEVSDLGKILLDARAITSSTSTAAGSDATKNLVFYTAPDRVLSSQPARRRRRRQRALSRARRRRPAGSDRFRVHPGGLTHT